MGGAALESPIIEAKLVEFRALRDEIAYRSRFQQHLIHLTLLVPGTVAAIVERDPANVNLLLVIPAICGALGLFFADHATAICLIGEYIKEELSVDRSAGRILSWEEWSDVRVKALPRHRRYGVPLGVVFVGPPVGALWVWTDLRNVDPFPVTDHVAWWLGVAVTAFMTAVLVTTNLKPSRRRSEGTRSRSDSLGEEEESSRDQQEESF